MNDKKRKLWLRIGETALFLVFIVLAVIWFQPVRNDNVGASGGYPAPQATGTVSTLGIMLTASSSRVLPTALPDNGVRIGSSSEVALAGLGLTTTDLLSPHLDGDLLTAVTRTPGGLDGVIVDLRKGQVRYLNRVVEKGFMWLQASGNYVVWVDSPPPDNRTMYQFHALDLSSNTEILLKAGVIDKLDLKGSIVVWQERKDGDLGIYGYDLKAAKDFTVAGGKGIRSFPRVCSSEWVTYLQNPQQGYPGSADLRAHNLVTGEDIAIGEVPYETDAWPGYQHACDGSSVAWVGLGMKPYTTTSETTGQQIVANTPVAQYHVYDLGSHTDHVIAMPGQGFAKVLFSKNVLVSTVNHIGYDMVKGQPFSVFSGDWGGGLPGMPGDLLLSNDRLIWLTGKLTNQPQHLLTASIIRH